MMTEPPTSQPLAIAQQRQQPSHIVAIGASAGGLQPLEQFFAAMSSTSGMAFVVIQHLSPDFKSLMNELLVRHTSMPIHRVTDGMAIEANAIYLIPPKTQMTIHERRLRLTERDMSGQMVLPIDVFLHSLAADAGERAVAIILSGTGSDGSRGIEAIAAANGLVLVQAPETAQFDGMPRSAIARNLASFIVAPDQMPDLLMRHASNPTALMPPPVQTQRSPSNTFVPIFRMLHSRYGLDFSEYKLSSAGRRIENRMAMRRIEHIEDFTTVLASDTDELDALYRDLLIGVTEFFRDTDAFDYLKQEVVRKLIADADQNEGLRIWVAGCATGEEAYSLAMLFLEEAQNSQFIGKITIFATDVHTTSLNVGATGLYNIERLKGVSPERLARFFQRVNAEVYRVSPELRRMLVFAQHNVIGDPPFTRIDLVCCRNLLIYWQAPAQERAIALLHYALNINGYLFLGSSEGLGNYAQEFDVINGRWKLFRKRRHLRLGVDLRLPLSDVKEPSILRPSRQSSALNLDRQLLHDYDVLLETYVPDGMLIDEQRRVLHYFGNVSNYLIRAHGRPEQDVLALLDNQLSLALSSMLQRVRSNDEQISTPGLRVQTPDGPQRVTLSVRRITEARTRISHYYVGIQPEESRSTAPAQLSETLVLDSNEAVAERMRELEHELALTRESLQATIEELQTTNEELQSTNEEMLAANEELQSTNEELQSVNEELVTVNVEFERKNDELEESHRRLDNLLGSLEIGVVLVDHELRVSKFNRSCTVIFSLLPQDVGRPLAHITYNLPEQEQMLTDLRMVVALGKPVERDVTAKSGRSYILRIALFDVQNGKEPGAVLSFVDITNLRDALYALQSSQRLLRLKGRIGRIGGWEYDPRTGKLEWSEQIYRLLDWNGDEGPDLNQMLQLFPPNARIRLEAAFAEARSDSRAFSLEEQVIAQSGRRIWLHIQGVTEPDYAGHPVVHGIIQDVTSRKEMELALRTSEARYRALAEYSSRGAVFFFDTDLRFTQALGPNMRTAGWSARQIEGRTLDAILPPERVAILEPRYRAALNGEMQVFRHEAGGRFYDVTILPIYNENGVLEGGMTVSNDVSDQVVREHRLNADEFALSTLLELGGFTLLRLRGDGTCLEYRDSSDAPVLGLGPGQHLADRLPPTPLGALLRALRESLSSQIYQQVVITLQDTALHVRLRPESTDVALALVQHAKEQ